MSSSTSYIIIDVQGFKSENNGFIPKELAAFNGNQISHYIFRIPFPFNSLPRDLQKQNKWLVENFHGINWSEGFTPLHQFKNIITNLAEKADVIYVKGKEKANHIRKYTSKPVVELEEHPALPELAPNCLHHSRNPCKCALSNVVFLRDTFMKVIPTL